MALSELIVNFLTVLSHLLATFSASCRALPDEKPERGGEVREPLGLSKTRATLCWQVKPIRGEANGDAHLALVPFDPDDLSLALGTQRTVRVRVFQHERKTDCDTYRERRVRLEEYTGGTNVTGEARSLFQFYGNCGPIAPCLPSVRSPRNVLHERTLEEDIGVTVYRKGIFFYTVEGIVFYI